MSAGISDTRQLDSVLRSVDQAQAGLGTVFEALPTLERRSLIYTPMQLRQVLLCLPLPQRPPPPPPPSLIWVTSSSSSLMYFACRYAKFSVTPCCSFDSDTSKVLKLDVHALSCARRFSILSQRADHFSHVYTC